MTDRIHVLRNEADYEKALAEVGALFGDPPAPGTAAGDRFEVLIALIEKYEDEIAPMPTVSAVEAIRFAMERRGLTQADLSRLLGSRSRASEILNNKREPTLDQMRLLVNEWGVPAAAFLGMPEAA
ncbi:helix-turn-helix domain-containing protein [Brevundimonas aveniformis]|uniref:helix-turn-helix domain-containing protein n=1 Tax=Brevundimonas aveniformis TaxID=370977 RepID=UPI00249320F4|nr:helix-turn-helix domain-containing protein [Brevundimonas aveniformis]